MKYRDLFWVGVGLGYCGRGFCDYAQNDGVGDASKWRHCELDPQSSDHAENKMCFFCAHVGAQFIAPARLGLVEVISANDGGALVVLVVEVFVERQG